MSILEEKYLEEGFTQDQIDEIAEGEAAGLDISIYAKKEFYAIQMRQIRMGLQDGLPVKIYARKEYDWFQMEELRKGLLAGVDTNKYASPDISYKKMRQLRKGLAEGTDLSGYLQFDAGVLRQLRKARQSHINITEFIKQGYDTEQLDEIRQGLEKGLDIKPYITVEFRGVSIGEICEGLEKGVDVSIYAKAELSWQQMREIRLGLENRVDISLYESSFYSWQQMREIRLGLEEGLDVSQYRSLMYTASEMKKIRLKMLERETNPRVEGESKVQKFKEYIITISPDEMEAHLEISGEGREVSREDITRALKARGVRHGIDETAIDKLVAGGYTEPILIARGIEPKPGEDGWYEFFFKVSHDDAIQYLKDGSIDYQKLPSFEMVKSGQTIAYYHEAKEGTPGISVTGNLIKARKGREKSILSGRGFLVQEDQKTYQAMETGRIEMRDGRVDISKLLLVEEVMLAAGKINFDGCVYIKGNVGSGTVIKATEDVIIDGVVDSAVIECGGSVMLRQGMNAIGNGYIQAGRTVMSEYLNAAKVYAGEDIYVNCCQNCDLYAERNVIVSGSNGMLVGGVAYAVRGITTCNLGSSMGLPTVVRVGINDNILKVRIDLENQIKEVNKELSILGNAYLDFQHKYPAEIRNGMDMYIKIESAIFTKEKQQEELYNSKAKYEDYMQGMYDSKVVVTGNLYEGVTIEVNKQKWAAKFMHNITAKRVEDRIAVYSN